MGPNWKHAPSGGQVLQDRSHAGARADTHLIAVKGDVSEVGSQIKHQRAIGSAKTAMAATAHHQGNALLPCLLHRLNNLSNIAGLQH